MATKIDPEYVSHVEAAAKTLSTEVPALISEVKRLEGQLEQIEKLIDPHGSPGGDTVWLVKNLMENVTAIMATNARLRDAQNAKTLAPESLHGK